MKASVGVSTEPIRASYIAITHPDLRQDVQALPGFVPVEKYSDQSDVIDGEIGGVEGVRFITTTQAVPFKDAGDTNGVANCVSTGGTNADVYPVLIFAEDSIGCATLGGFGFTPIQSSYA